MGTLHLRPQKAQGCLELSQQCSCGKTQLGFLGKLNLAVEDGDLRLLSTPLVWVCLCLVTSVPSWDSCRTKYDLFMRVKRGRIGTNRANSKNFKKANKKVIQFASCSACAYPDYSIQWICRHEFSGVFIGKAYKEIWQSLHREWINFKKLLCVADSLLYRDRDALRDHLKFPLWQFEYFRFCLDIGKLQIANISLQILPELWKNDSWGKEPYWFAGSVLTQGEDNVMTCWRWGVWSLLKITIHAIEITHLIFPHFSFASQSTKHSSNIPNSLIAGQF